MVKKADCTKIYTCENGTEIYVHKGKLSEWDFRVGFLKKGMKGTPRFAKHSHVIIDLYIKYFHNKELTKKLKQYFVELLDKVEPVNLSPSLAEVFKKLDKRGCKVMLSNSDTKFIRELYKDYNIHIVKAKRMINCNGSGRGEINELVVLNYSPVQREI